MNFAASDMGIFGSNKITMAALMGQTQVSAKITTCTVDTTVPNDPIAKF